MPETRAVTRRGLSGAFLSAMRSLLRATSNTVLSCRDGTGAAGLSIYLMHTTSRSTKSPLWMFESGPTRQTLCYILATEISVRLMSKFPDEVMALLHSLLS